MPPKPAEPTPRPLRFMRPAQVAKFLGTSPTTLWRWVRNIPDFPKPIKLGAGTTVWDEAELIAWVETKKAARD